MEITEDQAKVIEILANYKHTINPYGDPIYEVAKTMRWGTDAAIAVVEDLEQRKLILRKMDPFKPLKEGERMPIAQSWWERGKG